MTFPVLTERSTGIGGTDIAGIVGLHPQKDAFSVYAEKVGLLEDVIHETNQRARWGLKLQRLIAEVWSEVTGKPHEWLDRTFQGKAADFQIYTPDARCVAPYDNRGIDAKTAGFDQAKHWGESGTSIVPDHYAAQCAWYMSADDVDLWDIALLIAGNDFRIYTIHRDRALEDMLLEEADKFWREHVLARKPPRPGAGPASAAALKGMFPRNVADIREATPEESEVLRRLREVRARLNQVKTESDELENVVKLSIGASDGLRYEGGKVTWKKDRDTYGVDWEKIARQYCTDERILAEAMAANRVKTREGPRKFVCNFKEEGNK